MSRNLRGRPLRWSLCVTPLCLVIAALLALTWGPTSLAEDSERSAEGVSTTVSDCEQSASNVATAEDGEPAVCEPPDPECEFVQEGSPDDIPEEAVTARMTLTSGAPTGECSYSENEWEEDDDEDELEEDGGVTDARADAGDSGSQTLSATTTTVDEVEDEATSDCGTAWLKVENVSMLGIPIWRVKWGYRLTLAGGPVLEHSYWVERRKRLPAQRKRKVKTFAALLGLGPLWRTWEWRKEEGDPDARQVWADMNNLDVVFRRAGQLYTCSLVRPLHTPRLRVP
jgi:hypothetical protein